jgi:hypothetical protein
MSADKAGLERRMEAPRAGRSGVILSRTDPQRWKVYHWSGSGEYSGHPLAMNLRALVNFTSSTNGAATQTMNQFPARTSGKGAPHPSCHHLGE